MAEEEAAGRGLVDTLKHKVGPLPLGAYIVAFVVIYLVLEQRKKKSTPNAGQQTDSAGNVGAIDPQTGYVAGSTQDAAALAQQNAGSLGSSSGSGSTVAGQYTDNSSWARAAINLLVGAGIDPTEANSAIEQYISSQQLTPQQQADVNFAIQSLGAPPDPPQPGGAPTPIVKPPSPTTVYATNPPTGLAVTGVTASTIGLKWNRSTNATGYSITATAGNQPTASTTVTGTDATGTLTGLAANSLYTIKVQAQPARPGDGYATTTATTARGSAGTGTGGAQLTPGQVINVDYNSGGQSWDQIAAKFGISGQHLAQNNGATTASKPPNVVKVPYRIGQGDTLQSVAGKFGISVQHLQEFL